MKRLATLAILLLCNILGPSELSAQSLLNQLEQRLPGGSAPTAPPSGAAPQRGYLGAKLDNADEQGKSGVRVTEVVSDTPAEAGGLKSGDIITAINGKPVANLDVYDTVAGGPSGTRLQMTVDRGGAKVPVTVTLGTKPAVPPASASPPGSSEPHLGAPSLSPPTSAPPRATPSISTPLGGESPAPSFGSRPSSEPSPSFPSTLPTPGATDRAPDASAGGIRAQPLELGAPPSTTISDDLPSAAPGGAAVNPTGGSASIGISVLPLSDQARQRFGIPVRRGALIDSVKRGSPAEQAGLPVDGVIVRFDDRPIESDQDLINAVRVSRPGQEVEISYYEGNRLSRKSVRLAAAAASGAAQGSAVDVGGAPPSGGVSPPPGVPGAPRTRGAGGGLLSRIDRMADNLARPQSTMTVWDPLAMASLQARVEELTASVKSLEERLRALESKLGVTGAGAPPSSSPSSPATSTPSYGTPSFGAPSSLPSATPGLGPITNP